MSLAAFPRVAGAVVAAVGATALAGWILDREDIRAFFFTPPVTVKTNTAIGLLVAGTALWLLAPPVRARVATVAGRVLAALTLVIGVLTLSQHLVGWDLGIDEIFFREAPGALATISPNRTGPPASITFTLIGVALLVLDARGRNAQGARQTAAFGVLLIALLGAIGYATGVSPLYAVARATGVALVSAISFLLLAGGVAFARPDHGLVALLVRRDEAGAMARRLMIPSIVLPFAAAVALARGVQARWIDDRFATALMALILIVALTVVIAKATGDLARALAARDLAEAERSGREETLREINQRQREFLAVLSHELRNPLAPMRYALEMDRGWEDPGGPKEILRRQLGHLVRLVDDLLDVTRIATGKFQLRRRVVDLEGIFQHAVEATRVEIDRAGHRLEVRPAAEALWLEADSDRLVQVVSNLLVNAARYSPPGSTITLIGEADGDAAVIRVVDNGRGLDPRDLERVFEMFRQIGGPGVGGLGLGLSLARTIVGLHGGTIEARSEGPGRGAEFIVRLKRTEASPDTTASGPPPPPRPARMKVVVADDNQDSAEMMKALLEIDGHEVEVAFDGIAAADLIARFAPDAAVLDIGMPGLDGYEVARRVRASAGRAIYLVAVTGWGQESDRKRAREAGFDAHLTKPANPDEIRRLLGAR